MVSSYAQLPTSASFANINSNGLGSTNINNDFHDMGIVKSST